jgi:hypothetical protein
VSPKWQLYDMKPVANEDGGSLLPDVAEWAKEVIPVQHPARVILAARKAIRCRIPGKFSGPSRNASPLVDITHLLSGTQSLPL